MKKMLLSILFLCTMSIGQSHVVNGWKLPQYGYHRDSLPNWATLNDSLLSHLAARFSFDGTCSLTNVLTIASTTPAREFLLKLKGLGDQDAGILLTPSLHTSAFIDFEPDSIPSTSKRGRIGRNPYNQGAALFVGMGGTVGDAFQIGQRDAKPVQLFTGDACRLMVAGTGSIGIGLDSTKYDSLENHVTQSLWVRGGGMRCDNGYYDENGVRLVSSQWSTVSNRVDVNANIRSTAESGSIDVANGNVFLYGDATQAIFSLVSAGSFHIRTNNTTRVTVNSAGVVSFGVCNNYADSTAARTAGVADNQIYHVNGDLKIMY